MRAARLRCLAALFLAGSAVFLRAAEAPDDPLDALRAKLGEPKAWYLAMKERSRDDLAALLEKPWVRAHAAKGQTLWQILRWLAYRDPAAATAWLAAQPDYSGDASYWRAIAQGWAEKDPDAALRYFLTTPDLPEQNAALSTIFSYQIKNAPAWVSAHLGDLAGPDQQYAVLAANTWAWAGQAPEAASRWIVQFPQGDRAAVYTTSALAQWGRRDPDKAWAFVDALQGDLYQPAVEGFARGVMMRNLHDGLAFLDDMEHAGLARKVLRVIGLECGERDPERGLALWRKLTRADDRKAFAEGFLQNYARREPAKAAKLAAELNPSDDQYAIYQNIADAWVAKNPTAALTWIIDVPPDLVRPNLLRLSMDRWTTQHPAAAEKWLTGLPEGVNRRNANIGYLRGLSASDPARAANLALTTIRSTADRDDVLHTVLLAWKKTDAPAAANWLQGSNLDATEKEKLAVVLQ